MITKAYPTIAHLHGLGSARSCRAYVAAGHPVGEQGLMSGTNGAFSRVKFDAHVAAKLVAVA